MRVLGLTGTRVLTPARQRLVADLLADVRADRYVTGGAVGFDAFAGRLLALRWPQAEHVVVVPAFRGQVQPWWEEFVGRVTLEVMPAGSTFRDRNAAIVDSCDELVAFPTHPEADPRAKRSGTWQTVRLARRAALPVRVHVLAEAALVG